jgi:nucleotide-binding universal stress UspA family protein
VFGRVILVPVDGSDKDARAIPVAAALIDLTEATPRVLRVFEDSIASLPARSARLGVLDKVNELRVEAIQKGRKTAADLGALVHRDVTFEMIDATDAGAALLDAIAKDGVGLVVMATRAPSAIGRAIQGSVADRLARESPRPVVLVPPPAKHLAGKHIMLQRVLVPLDGSAASQRVIPYLLELPRASAMELVLIQAVRANDEGTHENAVAAERRLDTIAERLRERGSRVEVRVIESADPGAVIVDAVRNDLVELIAMSTRGASGLRRMVLGSVAEHVVRHSEVPVLLVTARSGARDRQETRVLSFDR